MSGEVGRSETSERVPTQQHKTPSETLQVILSRLDGVTARLDEIDARLAGIASSSGKRRVDTEWLSVKEAATLAGLSVPALRSRLRRAADSPGGCPVRRRHGQVHRNDFRGWLDETSTSGRGAVASVAVDEIDL